MTTTPRHRQPATGLTGLRRLGVLLVLAGVLAMHAMAGGSHMAMASATEAGQQPAASATAGEPTVADGKPMPGMAPARGGAAARIGSVAARRAADASAAPAAAPGPGVQTACLAVLAGLVLLAARAAVGVPRLLDAQTPGSAGHSSAPLGRGPPRQLLAQLCVLRT